MYVCGLQSAYRGQKKAFAPPGVGVMVLSHPLWVLGTELGSFVKGQLLLTPEPSLQLLTVSAQQSLFCQNKISSFRAMHVLVGVSIL